MKCIMKSDGFAVEGMVHVTSKTKLFVVKGDYKSNFIVGGDLDQKLHKGTFERYITIAMREMAKEWIKFEAKVTAPLQTKVNTAEVEIDKMAKSAKRGETPDAFFARVNKEFDKREKDLQTECTKLINETLIPALTAAGAKAHEVAIKTISGEAKGVLTSKKAIVFKIGGTTVNVGFSVTASVMAGLAIGGLAAGPAGAAVGATAAVVIAASSIALKGIATLYGLYRDAKSIRSDFNGNMKVYKASLAALRTQINETQKLSRALTAKWDLISLRHAELQINIDKISEPVRTIAGEDKRAAKLAELHKKLTADAATLDKFLKYDPGNVESAFLKMKKLLEEDLQAHEFDAASDKLDAFIAGVENLASAGETVIAAVSNG
jgi:hypothetical protein